LSKGEGVLQALGGAAFGIGEDSGKLVQEVTCILLHLMAHQCRSGGSVSMPASLNGLSSIKPSSGYTFKIDANGREELIPDEDRILMENAVNFVMLLPTKRDQDEG
jgi:hypothetical protein